MADRTDAYLLMRSLVADRDWRRAAQRCEAMLQWLAERSGQDVDRWAAAGLLAFSDATLTAENPAARGRVAAEQARAGGFDRELARALEDCYQPTAGADGLADALAVALALSAEQLAIEVAGLNARAKLARQRLALTNQEIDQMIAAADLCTRAKV
ncbi:MAG: hypothetical protein H6707_13680 [Deltaproteobacteria bacterium]|nr:hypothetical protein [Deltaproteobacteria bacterium]